MNLATEMTKKGTALALTTKGRRVAPIPADDVEPDHKADLAAAKSDIKTAWEEFKSHAVTAVEAGLRLGDAAARAKEALPHGEFQTWMEKNFKAISFQWVRACMRAASVKQIAKGAEQLKLVREANTVEKLAALKRTFEGKAPIEAPKRKGATLKRDDDVVDVVAKDVSKADAKRVKALDAREAEIEAREAELLARAQELKERIDAVTAREKECDRREKKLALAVKPLDDGPAAPDLQDARDALRKADARRAAKKAEKEAAVVAPIKVKRAPRKASVPASEPTSGEVDTSMAGSPENGSLNGAEAEPM